MSELDNKEGIIKFDLILRIDVLNYLFMLEQMLSFMYILYNHDIVISGLFISKKVSSEQINNSKKKTETKATIQQQKKLCEK